MADIIQKSDTAGMDIRIKTDGEPPTHKQNRKNASSAAAAQFFNKLDLFLTNTPRGVGLAGPKGG